MKSLYAWLSTKDLPQGWIVNKFSDSEEIQCIKLQRQQLHMPTVILHLLLIHSNLTWEVHTINRLVSNTCSVLNQYPSMLTDKTALSLIHAINESNICTGNFDKHFVDLAKTKEGRFTTFSGSCVATLEDKIAFIVNGQELYTTIRHIDCEILSPDTLCSICAKYRNTLRVLVWKQKKIASLRPHPKTNARFLRTPAHIRLLRAAIRNKNRQLKRLKCKLQQIVKDDGIVVDDELSNDLQRVVDENFVDAESIRDEFKRLFWQQQVCS